MDEKLLKTYMELAVSTGIRIIIALVLLVIGFWLIKRVNKIIKKLFNKGNLDSTLRPFLLSLINIGLKILLLIALVDYVGVQTSSIIAILGAASFAIGLAFQGSLSNLASGVLLLVLRPMRVGDYVEIASSAGTVESIQLFNTRIHTVDNKVIFIPNSLIMNEEIVNYSIMPNRRVDQLYAVGHDNDLVKVKNILMEVIGGLSTVLSEPKPFVALENTDEYKNDFILKVWVKSEHYWDTFYALKEGILKRFEEEGVSLPQALVKASKV